MKYNYCQDDENSKSSSNEFIYTKHIGWVWTLITKVNIPIRLRT